MRSFNVKNGFIPIPLLIWLILIFVLITAGFFFFFSFQRKTDRQSYSEQPLEDESESLRVAFLRDEGNKIPQKYEWITSMDINISEKKDIYTANKSQVGDIDFLPTRKKVIFGLCCEEKGLFLMNPDGSDIKPLSGDIPFRNNYFSPDGTTIVTPDFDSSGHSIEQIKIISIDNSQDSSSFNINNKDKFIFDLFWLSDSSGLIVTTASLKSESEIIPESVQISKKGKIIRSFGQIYMIGASQDRIFYRKNHDNKNLYVSNLNGKNEEIIFDGESYCPGYKSYPRGLRVVKDKIAFYVGSHGNPYLDFSPACNIPHIVIYDLKTKKSSEIGPYIHSWDWSPAGDYLVVSREKILVKGKDEERKHFIDLYSSSGSLIKNLLTEDYISINAGSPVFFIWE